MNTLEVILALLENVHCGMCVLLFLSATVWGCFSLYEIVESASTRNIYYESQYAEKVQGALDRRNKVLRMGWWLLIPAFFAALPSIDDIWRVRISLVKLQLASPNNIEKGTEAIERIAKKLECKYLGCDKREGR